MKDKRTTILIRNNIAARGLMHFIHAVDPEHEIEVVSSFKEISDVKKEGYRIYILESEILSSKDSVNLEKLYKANKRCKIIAYASKPLKEEFLSYFDEMLSSFESESVILQKLRKIYLPQESNNKSQNGFLSAREKEVLRSVALGRTNKEISEHLFISTHTVITHRKNISAKLGIKTIAGLAIYAILNGIIKADEME